ncbi:MAG: 23S rRNA (adenine(2503)-C(2))-methyltransferase RlmN [Verrucomicrobiales bacterium]|jgi:23S rRNA (adenine2503-C2)-methyltransferase|nr:23S rRNA (adenine(2503)-C(2))-methyltransferase RlmN [Verrucomicrobiales bacterium]
MKPLLLDQLPSDWNLGDAPAYRRQQLTEWIFQKRAETFSRMTNLPGPFRQRLSADYEITALTHVRTQGSRDTTRKFLFRLADGDFIESVLIPANPALHGERADRFTLCVSSQVGCAYGCKFCASGLNGWRRNLTPSEILAQIMQTEKLSGEKITNLVFMGMGEPLANYDHLMRAIAVINSDWGLNIGARRVTVSTSGIVPRIRDLADQPRQLRLAVSLHGADNDTRNQIMPVNKKYPLEQLLDACAYYREKKSQMLTFEYILIRGLNDTPRQAALLAAHASRLNAKINLIPCNPVKGLPWQHPADRDIKTFAAILKSAGITATIRLEKGRDIDAACGQLRLAELNRQSAQYHGPTRPLMMTTD